MQDKNILNKPVIFGFVFLWRGALSPVALLFLEKLGTWAHALGSGRPGLYRTELKKSFTQEMKEKLSKGEPTAYMNV